jgi:hypothetical protein
MMGSDQKNNEVRGFLVYPLIDSLVADREPRMFKGKSSRDKLRRPSPAKMLFDIPPDRIVLESWSPMGCMLALIRALLSFVSQIVPGINRRGIAFKLPRKSAGTSLERPGDLSQGVPFAFKDGKYVSFICT